MRTLSNLGSRIIAEKGFRWQKNPAAIGKDDWNCPKKSRPLASKNGFFLYDLHFSVPAYAGTGRAAAFAGRTEALAAACEKMGGEKAGAGDVSYNLPVFQALKLRLSFWDADDEFPASLSLLWDENVLDFMRYETTFYAAGYLLDRLSGWMNRI